MPNVLGLCGDETIIDPGGGLGVLANFIIDAHPGTCVYILECPEVVEIAQRRVTQKPGIHFHSQDLFAPWKVEANTVILARILHDWDDDDAVAILLNARSVLPMGGHLHILEMVPPEGSASGALLDLHLLAVTSGRERTTEEYVDLLEKSGFTKAGFRSVTALTSILTAKAE